MIEAVDSLGRSHRFDRPPRRVVSLVPSLTESLCDLGAGAAVVAVTDFCIFPESLEAVPRVGGTKNPRIDEIRRLDPDLVYVNLEENLRRHADAIEEFAPVFATEPKTVADVLVLLEILGAIHDRGAEAVRWRERIQSEAADVAAGRSFTFACPIWKEPWMWCGGDTYVSALISTAGGRNVLQNRARYPRAELDDVAALAPEVVFFPDEPYLFTADDAAAAGERMDARVIGPFPGHLFTWHGTRTALGLRFLREALG